MESSMSSVSGYGGSRRLIGASPMTFRYIGCGSTWEATYDGGMDLYGIKPLAYVRAWRVGGTPWLVVR